MREIRSQILEFFKKEKINVLYFKISEMDDNDNSPFHTNSAEIAIKIRQSDLPKWNYFNLKANENAPFKYFDMEYRKSMLRDKLVFRFSEAASIEEKVSLRQFLYNFLRCLKMKYYTVNPSKNHISVIAKTTFRCNMDCKYCYDKQCREKNKADMSYETFDRMLSIASQSASSIRLIFHGGEPTIVGTKWYEYVFNNIIPKYTMVNFDFSIMSNGTLINQEWIRMFKKYNIKMCISYNAQYQEILRCSNQERKDINNDVELAKKVEKVIKENDCSVVDVITKYNCKDIIKIYEYYKSIGKRHVIFNPVYETSSSKEFDIDMTPYEYSENFLKFFKYWIFDSEGIFERACTQSLHRVIGDLNKLLCESKDCRSNRVIGVNAYGDIYPCNRYFPENYKYCNVSDIGVLDDIYKTKSFNTYCDEIKERYESFCSKCNYFRFCYGGCSATVIETAGNARGIDEFACKSLQMIFNGIYEILRDIDSKNYISINNYASKIMRDFGFISVNEIENILKEINYNIPLEYDPKNLFNCTEYRLFTYINHPFINGSSEIRNALNEIKQVKRNNRSYNKTFFENFKKVIQTFTANDCYPTCRSNDFQVSK